jgi:hypothetical protein
MGLYFLKMEVLRSKQPRDIMSELAKPFSFGRRKRDVLKNKHI